MGSSIYNYCIIRIYSTLAVQAAITRLQLKSKKCRLNLIFHFLFITNEPNLLENIERQETCEEHKDDEEEKFLGPLLLPNVEHAATARLEGSTDRVVHVVGIGGHRISGMRSRIGGTAHHCGGVRRNHVYLSVGAKKRIKNILRLVHLILTTTKRTKDS